MNKFLIISFLLLSSCTTNQEVSNIKVNVSEIPCEQKHPMMVKVLDEIEDVQEVQNNLDKTSKGLMLAGFIPFPPTMIASILGNTVINMSDLSDTELYMFNWRILLTWIRDCHKH